MYVLLCMYEAKAPKESTCTMMVYMSGYKYPISYLITVVILEQIDR